MSRFSEELVLWASQSFAFIELPDRFCTGSSTDLADYLVKKGVPFRDAHEAVARAVRHAIAAGAELADVPLKTLQGFHPAIETDVRAVLTPRGSLSAPDVEGGTAPAQVRSEIAPAPRPSGRLLRLTVLGKKSAPSDAEPT